MKEVFIGGIHLPLGNFVASDMTFQGMKTIFCQCYQNYLRHLWLKFFIFQMSGRWFPWHPKGGGVHPPINLEVFFTHILATATRLNTSYGLETLHAQLSRHVGITQKVLRHIRHFWRIYDVINVGFFRHFAVFCYRKCHKVCRNSSFSHRICVLIGSTTLPSLKCNRLCVAELWRHIRRKSAISSTSLFKMTDF